MIKDNAFDVSKGVFSVPISKIEFFLPHFTVLPVFTKYGTTPKRAVGEKTDVVFGFRMKKYISLKIVFFGLLRPKLNFTAKLKKNFKSRKFFIIF